MILILTGRSGSGKSTIAAKLIERHGYIQVRACTTRERRDGEPEDAYHFLSKEEFFQRVDNGEFAEYDVYGGNCYGTLKSSLQETKRLVCVLTPNGAAAVKAVFPEAFIVNIDADMKTSVLRAIRREAEMDPEKMQRIADRAIVDETLFSDPMCDYRLANPDHGNLNQLANQCMLEHVKFYLGCARSRKGNEAMDNKRVICVIAAQKDGDNPVWCLTDSDGNEKFYRADEVEDDEPLYHIFGFQVDSERLKDNDAFKQAVIEASEAYCCTEEGRDVYEGNCHEFNWGDFVRYVPEELLNTYGIWRSDETSRDVLEVDYEEQLVFNE